MTTTTTTTIFLGCDSIEINLVSVVVVITASPRHLALKFSQNWVPNCGYILIVVIVADDVVIVLIIFSKKHIFKIWSKLGQ